MAPPELAARLISPAPRSGVEGAGSPLASVVFSVKSEGDRQRGVELGEPCRVEPTASSRQHPSWQREQVVTVGCTVMVETLLLADRDLGDVTVEAAGDQNADQ